VVTLQDLSRTGLFVRTDDPWAAGTPVRIALEAEPGRRLYTRGVVARRVTATDARCVGCPPGVGIALREPCEPADDLFGLGIEHLVRRSLREASEVILRGQLADLSLAAVLSLLELERKSGRLVLEDAGATIWIELVEGRIVDAGMDDGDGDAWSTLMHALDWCSGTFELWRATTHKEPRVGLLPITHLILEHARRQDEQRATA